SGQGHNGVGSVPALKSFSKILIANRGEIAVRIVRTCRKMGIATVAVYSDFDRNALHVRMADQAVPIGGFAARESYLNIEKIIASAQKTGAEAIHPGYGFLAENADFAAACEQAGIAFIGPRSSVIRALGPKAEARKLAQAAGVPVVPEPGNNDFPKLIKASAGGGGRGMRIVRTAAEYEEARSAARGEAERAFGDGTLLLEKYIEGARHIEVQIFGDHQGNVMHLFERDCSIQRRHQKIIEESPSPAVTPELRQRMAAAALALARELGYTNAGTVEFLLAPSGEFYFIEVNTRIQVEHPVTEMVTGLDLVRLQIEIAEGKPLTMDPPPQMGHAIEARLYAEDPANSFLPSTGTLHVWAPPAPDSGLRVDTGVEEGSEIGVYYDPLLAKVIAHAPDRDAAIRKLAYALRNLAAQGLQTNREFLIDVLEHPELRAGRAHTGLQIEARAASDKDLDQLFAEIAYAYKQETEHKQGKFLSSIPPRFRNNPYPAPASQFAIAGREFQVPAHQRGFELLAASHESVHVLVDGVRHHFHVRRAGETYFVRSDMGQRAVVALPRYPHAATAARQAANSPMPGQVLRVLVAPGQHVGPGAALVVLEAMKMEQTVRATISGRVDAVLVKPGEIVSPGQMLVEIRSMEDADEHASHSAAKH
ncbi:MAG TPA: biotin carboxylase N-terminal domain-containing protein, partial [Candidatus Sulfotelmatobacter sp.]|nr:biotin carboxylase N-terminal domain-containing protein [Candidatus Sulfotelmatobacter sp.]